MLLQEDIIVRSRIRLQSVVPPPLHTSRVNPVSAHGLALRPSASDYSVSVFSDASETRRLRKLESIDMNYRQSSWHVFCEGVVRYTKKTKQTKL